jgi:hypothetical protein
VLSAVARECHGAKLIGRVGAELDVEAGRKAAHLARSAASACNPASIASFRRRRPDPYERNAAISWHFERDPIPYAFAQSFIAGPPKNIQFRRQARVRHGVCRVELDRAAVHGVRPLRLLNR